MRIGNEGLDGVAEGPDGVADIVAVQVRERSGIPEALVTDACHGAAPLNRTATGKELLFQGTGSRIEPPSPPIRVDASFEMLLKDLAVDFVRVSATDVDAEIARWLQRIVVYFDADRSSIAEVTPTGYTVTHSWARAGHELRLGDTELQLPWLAARRLRGETWMFTRPDEIPPEAVAERALVERDGIKSHISLPLTVAGGVVGSMGIAYMRHECTWLEEIVRRLELVATILGNALARKRAFSERRQIVDALAHADRIAAMSQLASSFAHELSQPLAASLTNAQSALHLLDADPPDLLEVRETLADIVADHRRAGDIVRELRSYLRKHEGNVESVDVAGLMSTISRFMQPEARSHGVMLRFAMAEGLPSLAIDRVQIQQALVNLLLNAFQALSAQDSATREVVVSVTQPNAGRVAISVEDSGPGIPEAMRERLFTPFATTKADGLGLGLGICQAIAATHGGSLAHSTGSNGGAVFTFTVPAVQDRGLGG